MGFLCSNPAPVKKHSPSLKSLFTGVWLQFLHRTRFLVLTSPDCLCTPTLLDTLFTQTLTGLWLYSALGNEG